MNAASSKPWVVMVTTFGPYPLRRGNKVRIWEMTQYLRRTFRVGLATTTHFEGISHVQNDFDGVWTYDPPDVPSKRSPLCWAAHQVRERAAARAADRGYGEAIRAAARHLNDPVPPYAAVALDRLFRRLRPAAVVCHYIFSTVPALLVARAHGVHTVIDTHEVYAHRRATESAVGMPDQHQVSVEDETALLRQADTLLAIQPNDRNRLQALVPDREIVLCEHPCRVPGSRSRDPEPDSVLFVGAAYVQNRHGMEHFIETQWPQVRAQVPGAVLRVCGSVCEQLEDVAAAAEGVVLEGVVDDLRPYYERAALVVNPVQYGAGLKIKNVEALAHGACLATTPNGADGLEEAAGEALRVAEADRLADAVVALLRDPGERGRLAAHGERLAAARFSPESCFGALEAVLRREADARGGRPGAAAEASPCAE